jgi:hypothetical protein
MILLATGHQRAGKSSRINVNGASLAFANWSATAQAADLPTVNFTSFVSTAYSSDGITGGQSYDEGIQGILSANGNFGGDWDAGENPLDVNAPPGLYPRDNLQNVLFYTAVFDNVDWDFPYMRLRTAKNSAAADGKVEFSVDDWKNQGSFIFPTGSV